MKIIEIKASSDSDPFESIKIRADDLKALKEKVEDILGLKVKYFMRAEDNAAVTDERTFLSLIKTNDSVSFKFQPDFKFYFTNDEVRKAYSQVLESFVHNASSVRTKVRIKSAEMKFTASEPQQLTTVLRDEVEFSQEFSKKLKILFPEGSSQPPRKFEKAAEETSPIKDILSIYEDLCKLNKEIVEKELKGNDDNMKGIIPDLKGSGLVSIEREPNSFSLSFINKSVIGNFIEASLKVWQEIISADRQPTPNEYLMVHLVYDYLRKNADSNNILLKYSHGMGVSGFRLMGQTYMSVTDPGNGHIYGTICKKRWTTNGVIVHLEHLERPKKKVRVDIESYRVPSIKKFKFTRFHVADLAPQTLFIGRRLKDSGNFEDDALKVSRTFISCLDNMFSVGAAECKLSMELLSTYEAVKHMRLIGSELTRNPYQIVSSAWNINSKIEDDFNFDTSDYRKNLKMNLNFKRKNEGQKLLTDRFEIAKKAILYTKLGGFDKVTWDGASDVYPSQCIIPFQLTFEQGLTLVHLAHSVGLLTYFSAGFGLDEIKCGVLTGIDGIGIGGAQILRYIDSNTGYQDWFNQENIDAILYKRDEAEKSLCGRGIKMLCRLDTMYFEGSITHEENLKRLELYEMLRVRYSKLTTVNKDDAQIKRDFDLLLTNRNEELENLIKSIEYIFQLKDDDNANLTRSVYLNKLSRFARFPRKLETSLLFKDKITDGLDIKIEIILDKGSEKDALNFFTTYPWKNISDDYKESVVVDFIKNNIKF